jgi:hypothetical protein
MAKKFQEGGRGAKNNTNFLKKKSKNMLFLAGREEQEPLIPPFRTPTVVFPSKNAH